MAKVVGQKKEGAELAAAVAKAMAAMDTLIEVMAKILRDEAVDRMVKFDAYSKARAALRELDSLIKKIS